MENEIKGPDTREWLELKRQEVFESTLRLLENRRLLEAGFSVGDLEGTLRHLYVSDGNDWTGRGELGDIVMSATIAAYEHFMAEWKNLGDGRAAAIISASRPEET